MKYTHAIIYKGKYYRAGEDVPVEETPGKTENKTMPADSTAETADNTKDPAETSKRRGGKSKA